MRYLFNKKFFKSIKTIAFLSLFFSIQFFSEKASATAIASTLSWSTISPTATGTCVSGYYSTGWDGSSAYWLYTLSTCGYSNITMAANNTSSNTGPTGGDIYYSINGGTSYIYYGSYALTPCTGCCTITTITATFPTSCNNLATFLVKIIPYSCAGTGTNRIVSDGGFAGTPSGISTVSISSTSPAAGTIAPSSTNNLLQTFNMTVGTSATTLTDVTVNTLGTYIPTTDITNLKCWYSTSSTFSTGSATLLSTITPGVTGSSNSFTGLAQTLPVGASYIYITADVAAGATSGHTISLASIPSVASNFTFSTTCLTLSGSATASNTQTIASPTTPPSITSSPTNQTICSGTSTTFTATATGAPTPTYQWQRSTTGTGGPWFNITTGMDGGIYGASFTTNTLTITGATTAENGYAYQMIATNAYGTATSTPALLTVITVPTVAAITGTTVVCAGSTTALTDATAGGTWSSVSTGVATVNTTGVVTGVAAGTSVISYTITNACGTTAATTTVTVDPIAAAVLGTTTLCVGATSTLSTTTTGGTWTSSNPLIATIASTTGIVTGISQGTATIIYSLTNSCGTTTSTTTVTVNRTAAIILGTDSVCVGATTTLTDSTTGGTWSSSNPGVASVAGGVVTGVATGTATITYTVTNACGTSSQTVTVTVNTAAGAIAGTTTLCVGSTSTLSNPATGGTWTSSNPLIATIGSTTGIVTGVAQGTTTIIYSLTNSCGTTTSTTTVTVNRTAAIILGTDSVCVGATTTLTDSTTGGTWSSSNPGVASVVGGVVTGVANGTATITYTVTNACGTSSHTVTVTVNTAAGAIAGTTTLCVGSTSTLSNPATGGTWTSSNPLIASIGATSGIVTAISQGTTTINYTVTNSCGTTSSTTTVTVNRPAAVILGTDSVCVGSTTTLTDSTTGGAWSSSSTTVATVAGGVVTGISRGVATITYTVTNVCGTTSQTVNVTVSTLAASISGTSNLCVGATETLTDSVSGGSWTSVNPTIASVIATSGLVTGVSQGTTAIAYSVTNACGSSTASITINVSRPAAPVNGLDTVCTGSSIVLTDSTTGGTWSCSNAYATVSGAGIVTGVATGMDIITYTVTNICGTTFATKPVFVLAPPSAGTITGSNTVCSGYSIALASTVTGGTWTRSNICASISGSCLVTGFVAGIDTISYSVTNSCGTTVANTTITVNSTVIPTVSIAVYPNLFLCPGVRAVYTAVTTSGGSATTYQWTVNGTVVSTNDTFSNYPGNGDIVRCAIISNATCALPDTASNSVTVSVSPPAVPTVDFVSSGGDTTCLGVNNTFNASVTHGGSTPLIQWSVNWTLVGTGSTFSYTPANGDIVTCKLTSSSGCVFPDTAVKTMVMTVKPFETPLVNLNLNPGDSVCEGSPITLTVNPTYPGYTPSFYWYKNGSLAGFGTSYTYQPAEGDSMSCVMVSSYHCPIPSDTAKQGIKLHLVPVLHVMVDGRALIMQNQIDTFYVVTTNAGPAPTYQWLINSTPIWGATSTRFATPYITNFDSVSCIVTTHGNACEGVASFNWIIMEVGKLGVNQVNNGKSDIQLIPNPNKGTFVITGNIISGDKEVELQITDVVGQVVYSDAALITDGELKKKIYLNSNLANGIYLLHIKSANENDVISFSINR